MKLCYLVMQRKWILMMLWIHPCSGVSWYAERATWAVRPSKGKWLRTSLLGIGSIGAAL